MDMHNKECRAMQDQIGYPNGEACICPPGYFNKQIAKLEEENERLKKVVKDVLKAHRDEVALGGQVYTDEKALEKALKNKRS